MSSFAGVQIKTIPIFCESNILFIHGALCSNFWWEPLVDRIAMAHPKSDNMSTLFLFGLPGHNRVELSQGDRLSPKGVSEIVCDYLIANDVRKTNLVGHSYGGLCALESFAKKPDIFSKCFLINPHTPRSAKLNSTEKGLYESDSFGQKMIVNSFRKILDQSTMTDKLAKASLVLTEDAFLKIKDHFPTQLEQWSPQLDPCKFSNDVMAIHSNDDQVIPIEHFRNYFTGSKVKTQIYENYGHCPHITKPAPILDLIWSHFFNV